MQEFYTLFAQVFTQNGLQSHINEQNAATFERLCSHILQVNKVHNLTAIRDVPGVVTKHFADSLTVAAHVPQNAGVIDVGTGGGFPTLPLAVARPDLHITAIDSTAKKIAHVQSTAQQFGLSNVKAIACRAEELAQTDARESFDVATARAVSELRILCEITLPFVKVGGKLLAMKGASGDKELADATQAIAKLGGKLAKVHKFTLKDADGNEEERCIIEIQKISPTPNNFPRQYAQILKKPL
ncbi:MAG: 16S rRNA (guanine(527)-N(7))-methyltransferase RsmG [Clostridia bacterium]|nr:16S rRNA (guanine(527)-N(7))-methyltransferase RsmG [Clostridia bacterium]